MIEVIDGPPGLQMRVYNQYQNILVLKMLDKNLFEIVCTNPFAIAVILAIPPLIQSL